jgi:hypothetical protein
LLLIVVPICLSQQSVIAAIEKHPNVVAVQEHGLRVLNYLSDHHKSDVSQTSSIQTIVHAMQRFPNNPVVHANACRAIWALGMYSSHVMFLGLFLNEPFLFVFFSSRFGQPL